jgi:leucyl-tRNA synthetase
MILAPDGQKMSKSRGNVINPDEIVKNYGADTLRLYEMFMGPYDQAVAWDTGSIIGIRRFIEKIYNFNKFVDREISEVTTLLHQTIKKVGEDIENHHFNTAVSALMIFLNKISEAGCEKDSYKKFLLLLSPFAPHLSQELWHSFGGKNLVCQHAWPAFVDKLTIADSMEIAIQINGKVRDKITVESGASQEEIEKLALNSSRVQSFLNGAKPKKIIYIKNKLLSIVI